ATQINSDMPIFIVKKVQDALNTKEKSLKGSKILILGVTYKPDIDDIRESPALDVIGLLQNQGAEVTYHDPYITHISDSPIEMERVENLTEEVR
ncbi:MAG: UDP-N-acetyl-D-glucosamine dehydrogenase, partial [Deltaproteobacteria bacterium]|nr:UDP-N-acetyl-D-glucosamine dehydrogenase [Deltaproteobacteria bacterium]